MGRTTARCALSGWPSVVLFVLGLLNVPLKTIVCFAEEMALLEGLGYRCMPLKGYLSNRAIFRADVALEEVPAALRARLFEAVGVSATRRHIESLQREGIPRLYKANRQSVAIYLKGLDAPVPSLLVPYTNFAEGAFRELHEDIARGDREARMRSVTQDTTGEAQ